MSVKVNNQILGDYAKFHGVDVPGGLKTIGIRGCIPIGDAGEISLRGDAPNIFSDTLGCFGSEFGLWVGTTLPGVVADPPNPRGLAKLCTMEDAGRSWTFERGMHHGQYPCLIQDGQVWVRRDNNYLDKGNFAIEIHHAGVDSSEINTWSEGCNVYQKLADWQKFCALIMASGQKTFQHFLLDGPAFIAWGQKTGLW